MITHKGKQMPKLPPPSEGNPIVPTGTYKVRVLSQEHCQAKTGTPQIRWKSEILEPSEQAGTIIVDHTAMTDAAIWRVSNLIGACGIKFDSGIDTTSQYFDQLCQACIGRTTYWRNEVGKDQAGSDRNNIKAFETDKDQEVIEFAEEADAAPAQFED